SEGRSRRIWPNRQKVLLLTDKVDIVAIGDPSADLTTRSACSSMIPPMASSTSESPQTTSPWGDAGHFGESTDVFSRLAKDGAHLSSTPLLLVPPCSGWHKHENDKCITTVSSAFCIISLPVKVTLYGTIDGP
ncbi:hypothetical protein J0S82_012478, partial [Galemys pyrenaicus]